MLGPRRMCRIAAAGSTSQSGSPQRRHGRRRRPAPARLLPASVVRQRRTHRRGKLLLLHFARFKVKGHRSNSPALPRSTELCAPSSARFNIENPSIIFKKLLLVGSKFKIGNLCGYVHRKCPLKKKIFNKTGNDIQGEFRPALGYDQSAASVARPGSVASKMSNIVSTILHNPISIQSAGQWAKIPVQSLSNPCPISVKFPLKKPSRIP